MPDKELPWHLHELARRVLERPSEKQRIIRTYHATLVGTGDTFAANAILTVLAITDAQGETPPIVKVRSSLGKKMLRLLVFVSVGIVAVGRSSELTPIFFRSLPL
jgi:hypothetical protein